MACPALAALDPDPPDEPSPAQRAANAARRSPGKKLDLTGITILVIEDHSDSREMLRQIVASFGATVVCADDGRSALRTVAWVKPNLIFCDLRMPGMDGFRFLDAMRLEASLSRIPVIAVTALGTDADFKRTWDAGFSGHLVKPIDYATIAAQLARVFWAHRPPTGDDQK